MKINYKPHGVCSQMVTVSAESGLISDIKVLGGCDGNLQGLISLLKGMRLEDAFERLNGIRCGNKDSSCPDQISLAIKKLLEQEQ